MTSFTSSVGTPSLTTPLPPRPLLDYVDFSRKAAETIKHLFFLMPAKIIGSTSFTVASNATVESPTVVDYTTANRRAI
jgi:hypothetical protein